MSLFAPIVVFSSMLMMLFMLIVILTRYKRCAPDQLLVIYGRVGPAPGGIQVIHHGGKFVWPIIQHYQYLSLAPVTVTDRHTKERLGVVQISADPQLCQVAAERLLSLSPDEILDFVTGIFEDFDDEERIESELQKSGMELVRYPADKRETTEA